MSKHWYNNGIVAKQFEDGYQNEGFVLGRTLGIDEELLCCNIREFVQTHEYCRLSEICTSFNINDALARRIVKQIGLWHLLNHDNNMIKNKATKLERYGDENYNNISKIVETTIKLYGGVGNASTEIREKYEKTMVDKYGVKHNWASDDADMNGMNTKVKQFNGSKEEFYKSVHSKGENTRQLKYNDKNYSNHEKACKTNEERYGHKYFVTTKKCRERLYSDITKNKRISTMKKNNSFNKSKPEEDLYQKLILIFGKDNVLRQYKDERYPFQCDFYITSTDQYIECNYHWTHGKHPFDENNKDDILLLEKWKKSNKKYYQIAANVWTKHDVNKMLIAIQNNLNYVVLYNKEDEDAYIRRVQGNG